MCKSAAACKPESTQKCKSAIAITDDAKRVAKITESSKIMAVKRQPTVKTDDKTKTVDLTAIREVRKERDARREIREISDDRRLGNVRIIQILNDVNEVTREDQRKRIANGSALTSKSRSYRPKRC